MTQEVRRTMGDRCPLCNTDISGLFPIQDFPNLCKKCADKERAFRSKRVDGRDIPVEQKTLF